MRRRRKEIFSLFTILLIIQACAAEFFTYLKGANPSTGIVLLHGRGRGGPDQHVISTLRYALRNWLGVSTIAPVLPFISSGLGHSRAEDQRLLDSTEPETFQTITDSIERLKSNGITRIYLMGHSRGAWAISTYITKIKNPNVAGVVFIGGAFWAELPNTELPILDVYGTAEPRRVLIGAERRGSQFANQPNYKQVAIEGAEHLMYGYEERLINTIVSWIETLEKKGS